MVGRRFESDLRLQGGKVARIPAVLNKARFAKLPGLLIGSFALAVCSAGVALAQNSPNATVTPTKNTGGWVYGLAVIVAFLGILFAIVLILSYMRYAPRFQRGEGKAAHGAPGDGGRAALIEPQKSLEPLPSHA